MISSRQQKCKSSSKNLTSREVESSPFLKGTSITSCKPIEESYKKLATIGLIGKANLSRELFRENKENQNFKKEDVTISNNSEYIRSLYRKYLGKDDADRNLKTDVKELSHQHIKEIQQSTSQQRLESQDKVGRIKEKETKKDYSQRTIEVYPAPTLTKSFSKKESYEDRRRPDKESDLLLELGDPDDSCIKALKVLRKASNRSVNN